MNECMFLVFLAVEPERAKLQSERTVRVSA